MKFVAAMVSALLASCTPASQHKDSQELAAPFLLRPIVYYLHGKIVEDLGPRGVSPRFGAYDYSGIVDAFRKAGVDVISEVRPKDTDPSAYADRLVADIRGKVEAGVPPSQITVVGASKGSAI